MHVEELTLLEAVLSMVGGGIFVVDRHGRVLRAHGAARERLGRRGEEGVALGVGAGAPAEGGGTTSRGGLSGAGVPAGPRAAGEGALPSLERVWPELAAAVVPRLDESIGDGRALFNIVGIPGGRGATGPGDGPYWMVSVIPLLRGGEAVRQAGVVILDASRRGALEEQLTRAQRMVFTAQLAAGAAHDLNNLIGAITIHSQMALAAGAPEELREDLVGIERAARQAGALVRVVLAAGRPDGALPGPVLLNRLISEIAPTLRRLLPEGISLVVELDPELATIQGDAGQLEQVLLNLVVNARDAMPASGTITVRTANVEIAPGETPSGPGLGSGRYVMLMVADTGVGMDAETQARIFEPFFTTKRGGPGMGLGLSTVYGIVKQWQGYIYVESAPGAGATFRVYLPRR